MSQILSESKNVFVLCLKYLPLLNSLASFNTNQTLNIWSLVNESESLVQSFNEISGIVKDVDMISDDLLVYGTDTGVIRVANLSSKTMIGNSKVLSQTAAITSIRKLYDGKHFNFNVDTLYLLLSAGSRENRTIEKIDVRVLAYNVFFLKAHIKKPERQK